MKIHELLDRDPRSVGLANNGQARISDTSDVKAQAELRAELETFVCDAQFSDALQRILDRYLANLDAPRQDAAWVSGFFGSGKSHLLKMLTHLWVDTPFDDGSTARALVHGGLPGDIAANLRELDTQAKRTGKRLVAAAGTLLGGTDHVRHSVLSILLRACGWPAHYPQAMFCFWLRQQKMLEPVRAAVEAAGRTWPNELGDLYVSPVIARALIQTAPDFAADEKAARQVLVRQYSLPATDITTDQFIDACRKALTPDGELPLTVLVLDEVQQYIGDSAERAAAITEVAEAVQTRLDSRVMLVGAGQSALSAGTPNLLRLRDRFRITVELSDADVEVVTRKVLLQKKPSAKPSVDDLFEKNVGEVARHLQGSRIAQRREDARLQNADYPLLLTRRRFWEACFQAVDALGTQSQLRSQLRILHDSLRQVSEREVGAVIPTSDLFHALAPDLVNTGVLLNEINTRIQKLDNGTADGKLRRDLCGIVFLIGKLPRQDGVDLGIRATATTVSDLQVDDVRHDSGPFRKRVAETLETLASDGVLLKIGEEFRLQTTEGAEWDRAFRERQSALRQNEVEITTRRDQLFGRAVQETLAPIKLSHGDAKVRRNLALHTGALLPPAGGEEITVWARDGWSCPQKDVEREARRLGNTDPVLHVHLPKEKNADPLKDRIVEAEAARQVLDHYGVPAGESGKEARAGMESRLRVAEASRDEIVRDIIRSARVFQGGGSEVFGEGLQERILAGAQASLARLFPRFGDGDHRAWEMALKRAREGSDQPLKVVGWDRPTEDHPVAREALACIGAAARGSDVHKALKAAPFGWPQDATDTVLIALHRSGHLRATRNGQPMAPGSLDHASIKSAELRPEKVRLTTTQRLALRGLFAKVGITTKSGEEELRAPAFLDAMTALASRAGGQPPLPPSPDTTTLEEANRLAGGEQLAAILDRKDEIEASITTWTKLAERAAARRPSWDLARSFCGHAQGLPVARDVSPQLDAIASQRALLDDPDPVAPLLARLASALREAMKSAHASLASSIQEAKAMLAADITWTNLDGVAQEAILRGVGLEDPPALQIATDQALRLALDTRPLTAWRDICDAVPRRAAKALDAAANQGSGDADRRATTVAIRRGTLVDEAAVRAWLAEHEDRLLQAAKNGPVIVS